MLTPLSVVDPGDQGLFLDFVALVRFLPTEDRQDCATWPGSKLASKLRHGCSSTGDQD
jgi:hypothetical protein